MFMFVFSLIITALFSLTMIGFGFLFIKSPPKDPNNLLGYCTKMSTLNQDTWDFAHHYSGKVWITSGIITAVVSFILIVLLKPADNYNILMRIMIYAQLIVLLLVIPITEVKLHQTFDDNGQRKE